MEKTEGFRRKTRYFMAGEPVSPILRSVLQRCKLPISFARKMSRQSILAGSLDFISHFCGAKHESGAIRANTESNRQGIAFTIEAPAGGYQLARRLSQIVVHLSKLFNIR
jgi:hypothetical protein